MYNTDIPGRAELPTSKQLFRSTLIAGASAIAILVAIVLPSEYAIDPTGVGKALGLTEMGEIKAQLAAEAEADAIAEAASQSSVKSVSPDPVDAAPSVPVTAPSAPITSPQTVTSPARSLTSAEWNDEMSVTLKPGEGAEVKMTMRQGAKASYSWSANGAVVNVDAHGDGGGRSVSYQKDRGVGKAEGTIEAAFDGNHGWYWRNRTEKNVTITLRTKGDYTGIKRVI